MSDRETLKLIAQRLELRAARMHASAMLVHERGIRVKLLAQTLSDAEAASVLRLLTSTDMPVDEVLKQAVAHHDADN